MTVDKRRTNACLKACEGISTQNLEDNVPFLELARRYNVVLCERDALRAKIEQMGKQTPRETIERMLTQLMDIAVSNGANSVSMPDEYVEVAAWLCGIPAQPAPSVPDGWKEAVIAWEVCASIHREYGKGKDPFFNTRQGDFVKHANDARAMLAKATEAKP